MQSHSAIHNTRDDPIMSIFVLLIFSSMEFSLFDKLLWLGLLRESKPFEALNKHSHLGWLFTSTTALVYPCVIFTTDVVIISKGVLIRRFKIAP